MSKKKINLKKLGISAAVRHYLKSNKYGTRVFVSGASSGIGRACALAFAKRGCEVTGVSRHCKESARTYAGGGSIKLLQMDVTDRAAVEDVIWQTGPFDIAVLAAGMGVAGPIEEMPADLIQKQMDVNYFGVLNVCRELLPVMRKQKHGLILVVSSIAGRVPIPMQSHYSSSKFALEAYVASLRMEMKPFGVQACLLEPGDTRTGFTDARESLHVSASSPYRKTLKASVDKMAHDEQHGKPPKSVARAALRLATKKHPPVRTAIGLDYKLLMVLLRFLPDRAAERILMKLYLPK